MKSALQCSSPHGHSASLCLLSLSTTLFCQSTSVQSFTCLSTCQVFCFVHLCPVLHLSVHLSSPLLFHICPVLRLSVHLSSPSLCSPLSSPSLVCPLVKSFAFSHLSCPSLVCLLVKSFALFTSVESFTCLSTCQVLQRTCTVCLVLHVCPFLHLCVHLPVLLIVHVFFCLLALERKAKHNNNKSSSSSLEARLLQCCIFLHILIQTGCLTPETACLPVLPPLGWGHDLSMQYKH